MFIFIRKVAIYRSLSFSRHFDQFMFYKNFCVAYG